MCVLELSDVTYDILYENYMCFINISIKYTTHIRNTDNNRRVLSMEVNFGQVIFV